MQGLNTIILDSSAISCSIVLNPNISISSLLGCRSNLPFRKRSLPLITVVAISAHKALWVESYFRASQWRKVEMGLNLRVRRNTC